MKRFYTLAIAAIAVIGLALFATPASAVHKGAGGLSCGGCHTMHNSQGGAAMDGGALKARLLRGNATVDHGFCLMCHAADGSQQATVQQPGAAVAPKVLTANVWSVATAAGFSTIGAGGDFGTACGVSPWTCTDGGAALGRAHSLGEATSTPPGGDATMVVTCVSCHDPHGTDSDSNATVNKFRNLRFSPLQGAGTINAALTNADRDLNLDTGVANGAEYTWSWKGSTRGTVAVIGTVPYSVEVVGAAGIWPISDGTPTNSLDSNQYTATGVSSTGTGISGFCSTCHDNWHEGGGGSATNIAGGSWNRHPVDYIVNSADTSANTVGTINWTNYGTTTPLLNRVPMAHGDGFQGAAGVTYAGNTDNQDKVFCLSCHFAHGGPYYDTLRWEHASAVAAGSQTASAIINTVGCQQCHLR